MIGSGNNVVASASLFHSMDIFLTIRSFLIPAANEMEDDDIIEIRSNLAEEVDDAVIHAIHTDGNCSTPQGFSPHTPADDTRAEEDVARFGGA